jgi:hypothetical protein
MGNGTVSESAVATTFVPLKGGLIVVIEALHLAWALEDRRATPAIEGEDLVVEWPARRVDRERLRGDPAMAVPSQGHRDVSAAQLGGVNRRQ